MSIRNFMVCEQPDKVVHISIRENIARNIGVKDLKYFESLELTHPDQYQAYQAKVEDGTAVITSKDKVAVYYYDRPYTPNKTLMLMNRSDYEKLLKDGATREPAEIDFMVDIKAEVDDGVNGQDAVAAMAMSAMASGSYATMTHHHFSENSMNPPVDESVGKKAFIAGEDITAVFGAPSGSDVVLVSAILGKACKFFPKSMMGEITIDADKRYPTKYAPAILNKEAGFVTLHKNGVTPMGCTEVPTVEDDYSYMFYPLATEGLDIYPDVLADVIAADSSLQTFVNMSGKIRIAVNGIKSMFAEDEDEEKKGKIIEVYLKYFRETHYFRILHVSWKTGLVTAITPDAKPVLLCAAIRKGNMYNYDLKSFIPICKSIGLVVVGINNIDYAKLSGPVNKENEMV